MLIRVISSELSEMANLFMKDTNLPYDIWIDSFGSSRKVSHSKPRLKVDLDKKLIPVSIEREPKILVNVDIPKFRLLIKFIRNNLEVLMKHWNREINDKELKKLIKKI